MARMGHYSERAAIIYQHAARSADEAITQAMDAHVEADQPDDEVAETPCVLSEASAQYDPRDQQGESRQESDHD